MCGIAGIIPLISSSRQAAPAVTQLMLDAMVHRGPDSGGVATLQPGASIGCRRLAITDPYNSAADMPFSAPGTGLVACLNGEIYNHQTLRRELRDYQFKTQSDTETLLAAYLTWGRDAAHRFSGMFAFCIADTGTGDYWLANDATGQKSLYFSETPFGLIFSSEIDSLIAGGAVDTTLCEESLQELVARRYIIGSETAFRHISRLEPGSEITIRNGTLSRRFWNVFDLSPRNPARSLEDAATELDLLTHEILKETFISEFPPVLLLSGGVDSGLVASHASRAGLAVSALAAGFELSEGYEHEFERTQEIADYTGLPLSRMVIREQEYLDRLEHWAADLADPIASYEAICLSLLFQRVQQSSRIALCGSGADELFDGYLNGFNLQAQGVTAETLPEQYARSYLWLYDADLDSLFPVREVIERLAHKIMKTISPSLPQTRDVISLTQLINVMTRGSVYEFRQLDHTSMAHSVEARSPWGDVRLARWAFQLPAHFLSPGGRDKEVWRKAAARHLPERLAFQKKVAFPVPPRLLLHPGFESLVSPILRKESRITQLSWISADYLRERWQTRTPEARTLFFRLYLLEKLLERFS